LGDPALNGRKRYSRRKLFPRYGNSNIDSAEGACGGKQSNPVGMPKIPSLIEIAARPISSINS
jgi:hypothetical protein